MCKAFYGLAFLIWTLWCIATKQVTDNEIFYLAAYKGSKTLDALTALENLALDNKRDKPADLRKKKKIY